ncbi:MAG: DUF2270 domain-containing protein [Rhizobacter sp.]|nr:DUF2270 domain-containing protein [Burkholderiaceae bacterium]MCO5124531.1 DUF2270 domain-containing protein [Rhizobacter sp.]
MTEDKDDAALPDFTGAELGALAHLYRGEIYRSTIWRTRLDTTTNWSVVTLGVALSIVFSSPSASPLPLLLVGVLILLFLMIEARRYRYFNVWRARCRWIENNFYVPLLDPHEKAGSNWRSVLAADYRRPTYHVSFKVALGRRIRRNYLWIVTIQACAFVGKLLVHPTALNSFEEFFDRANVGPVPGEVVLAIGVLYLISLAALAIWSEALDSRKWGRREAGMG